MKQPLLRGRKLPRNDWEGDDFTPGAGGSFVTCQDTAAGRMLAYATNGRVDLDGRQIRAAILPHDSDGISLRQVAEAVLHLTGEVLLHDNLPLKSIRARLRAGRGLVVDGHYAAISWPHRFQHNADFDHAIWASHYSPTSGYRVWDPLNPDTAGYGRWMPAFDFERFAMSLGGLVGWINLEALPTDAPTPGSHQTAHI